MQDGMAMAFGLWILGNTFAFLRTTVGDSILIFANGNLSQEAGICVLIVKVGFHPQAQS